MRYQTRVPSMTNRERELVFFLSDGHQELINIIFQINIICSKAREADYLLMLEWLKKNELRGSKLLDWIRERNDGSVLQAVAEIRKNLLRDRAVRPIFGH